MGFGKCAGFGKEYKVPQTTLQRFAKSNLSPEECVCLKVGRKPVLPSNMQHRVVNYLVVFTALPEWM